MFRWASGPTAQPLMCAVVHESTPSILWPPLVGHCFCICRSPLRQAPFCEFGPCVGPLPTQYMTWTPGQGRARPGFRTGRADIPISQAFHLGNVNSCSAMCKLATHLLATLSIAPPNLQCLRIQAIVWYRVTSKQSRISWQICS